FGQYPLHLIIDRPFLMHLTPAFEAKGANYLARDRWLGATVMHYCDWETGYTRAMQQQEDFAPCVPTAQLEACLKWVQKGGLIDKEVPFLGSVSDQLYGAADPALREWAMGLTAYRTQSNSECQFSIAWQSDSGR
ncbi:MAG TPA: hypothetical protein PLV25_04450, partial [Opitutales bacterium]|nr:hypothetical protein [Opitutales bacterium]